MSAESNKNRRGYRLTSVLASASVLLAGSSADSKQDAITSLQDRQSDLNASVQIVDPSRFLPRDITFRGERADADQRDKGEKDGIMEMIESNPSFSEPIGLDYLSGPDGRLFDQNEFDDGELQQFHRFWSSFPQELSAHFTDEVKKLPVYAEIYEGSSGHEFTIYGLVNNQFAELMHISYVNYSKDELQVFYAGRLFNMDTSDVSQISLAKLAAALNDMIRVSDNFKYDLRPSANLEVPYLDAAISDDLAKKLVSEDDYNRYVKMGSGERSHFSVVYSPIQGLEQNPNSLFTFKVYYNLSPATRYSVTERTYVGKENVPKYLESLTRIQQPLIAFDAEYFVGSQFESQSLEGFSAAYGDVSRDWDNFWTTLRGSSVALLNPQLAVTFDVKSVRMDDHAGNRLIIHFSNEQYGEVYGAAAVYEDPSAGLVMTTGGIRSLIDDSSPFGVEAKRRLKEDPVWR